MYRARAIRVLAGGRAILDGADIELVPGSVTVLVGPNGAGKSTLLKVVAGERKPDAGEVTLDDLPLQSLTPATLARRRAVLPQSAHVSFPFTVAEIVALGLPPGLGKAQSAMLVSRALQAVDLADFGPRILNQLSGGEQQRAQFARVLAQTYASDGCYLLLDEPTASLDLSHQLLALKLARAHVGAGGGVLMVLHDLNLACMAADEIVAMKAGKVVVRGAPHAVINGALIETLYGMRARIGSVPDGPFVLPQMMG